MSKVILHAGAHKTGTTFLQRTFHQNRKLLESHGVIYPDIGPNPAHHILAGAWMPVAGMTAQNSIAKADALWKKLVRDHAASDRTLFLSAELFSRAKPNAVDMKDLQARLAPFDEVEVLYATREQLGYLQSVYLEVGKGQAPPPYPAFLRRALAEHTASGLWLDHNDVYDHLLTGFAAEQIRFADYDTIRRHKDGLVGFFLDLLGLPVRVADLAPLSDKQANISPSPLAAWVAQSVAAPDPAPSDLLALADRVLTRQFGADRRTTLYTAKEARQIIQRFSPLNARLQARIRRHQPEFTMPDLGFAPDCLHRDQLTRQFWAKMVRELYRR